MNKPTAALSRPADYGEPIAAFLVDVGWGLLVIPSEDAKLRFQGAEVSLASLGVQLADKQQDQAKDA